MKLYLAGKMSGIPQFNFPAFDDAATKLRASGYEIVSPAEIDDPETRAKALASHDGAGDGSMDGNTWGDFLARDVKIIADEVDGIVFLPNWTESRGARLEAFVALLSYKPYYFEYYNGQAVPMRSQDVRRLLLGNMP
jgi:Domain of unknown function (DUF4406)